MHRLVVVAAAALALSACGEGLLNLGGNSGGVPLPDTPPGKQAPVQVSQARPSQGHANLSAEERTQLEDLVRSYIGDVQGQFGAGLVPVDGIGDTIVALQPGTDHRWYVQLAAGTPYRFIAACDNECDNVDFELIHPQGGVVASDLLPDDFPVVDYQPTENGRFIARLIMQSCTVAPCYTGARALTAPPAGAGGQK